MVSAVVPALVVLACASTSGGWQELTDWRPPPGQRCSPSVPAASVPDVGEIVDTAGLRGALAGISSGTHALFGIRRDSTGAWVRPDFLEGDVNGDEQATLGTLLRRHLLPDDTAPALQLRIDLEDPPRMRVASQISCAPAFANRQEVTRAATEAGRRLGVGGTFMARVRVLENGSPGEVEIARSSGSAALDAAISRILHQARFHPAIAQRVPVSVWATFPVRVPEPGEL